MPHKVKCFYCGKYFDRDKVACKKITGTRYAHAECNEDTINTQEDSAKEDLAKLEAYIKKLFKTEYVNQRIKKQINDFFNNYNYTYSGMLKALIYTYEIKGNSIEKANGGIGIIPYVYDNAYKYYHAIWLAQQFNDAQPIEQYKPEETVVIITSPRRKDKRKKLFAFLDREGLEDK